MLRRQARRANPAFASERVPVVGERADDARRAAGRGRSMLVAIAAHQVRGPRERLRAEDVDRPELVLEVVRAAAGPSRIGRRRPDRGRRRGLLDGGRERLRGGARVLERRRGPVERRRSARRSSPVARSPAALIRPLTRAAPPRPIDRHDQADQAVDDAGQVAQAAQAAAADRVGGRVRRDVMASDATRSPTAVGSVRTSGASSAAYSANAAGGSTRRSG